MTTSSQIVIIGLTNKNLNQHKPEVIMKLIKHRYFQCPIQYQSLLFIFVLLLSGNPVFSAEKNDVNISNVALPDSLITRQAFTLKLRLNNNGRRTLSAANDIKVLLESDNNNWTDTRLDLGKQTISPGQSGSIVVHAKAPANPGIHNLTARIISGNKTISALYELRPVTVETRENYVNFISQVIPENMQAGNRYRVLLQYKNAGRHVWTNNDNYRIELFGKNRKSWKTDNIKLPKSSIVPPGEIATFRFDLTAPKKAGRYELQMRLKKGKRTFFGEPSPIVMVNVSKGTQELDAEFLHQAVPGMQQSSEYFTIFQSGQVYPVTLTFKNRGTQPWLPGVYQLVALHDNSELLWSVGQIDLKTNEVVRPGQIKSFNFKIIAPLEKGIYDFHWQIRKGNKTWIGEASERVIITVQ